MDSVEYILNQLELIIRGGIQKNAADSEVLLNEAYELFEKQTSLEYQNEINKLSDEEKVNFAQVAVKLHNKARNISSKSHNELRSILKAIAGWMLLQYSKPSAKVISVVIRLLSRSAQEMQIIQTSQTFSRVCIQEVIECWRKAQELSAHIILPPLEIQDMKTAVFQAYIMQLKSREIIKTNEDLIRRDISGALELVQTLPVGLRIVFGETVLFVCNKFCQDKACAPIAIHCLQYALSILEVGTYTNILVDKENQEVVSTKQRAEVLELIVKVKLCMAYSYAETNQSEKALGCIQQIENSVQTDTSDKLLLALQYTKLVVQLKDSDLSTSCETLHKILKWSQSVLSYDMALQCVNQVVSAHMESNRDNDNVSAVRSDFFRILASKFSKDPDFTTTRISHIQSIILQTDKLGYSDSKEISSKALEICHSVISDHVNGLRVLNAAQSQEIQRLLNQRIQMYRSTGEWLNVIRWCDELVDFLSVNAEQKENSCVAMMVKSDAFINIGDYDNAVTISTACLSKIKNTRTIMTYFRSKILSNESIEDVVIAVLGLLNFDETNSNYTEIRKIEILTTISMFWKLTQSLSLTQAKKDRTMYLLFKHWIKLYLDWNAWKLPLYISEVMEHSLKPFETFLRINCESLQLFLKCTLTSFMTKDASQLNPTIVTKPMISEFKSIDRQEEQIELINLTPNDINRTLSPFRVNDTLIDTTIQFGEESKQSPQISLEEMRAPQGLQTQLTAPQLPEISQSSQDKLCGKRITREKEVLPIHTKKSVALELLGSSTHPIAKNGYTDCCNNNGESHLGTRYQFSCSIAELVREIFNPIENISRIVNSISTLEIEKLGQRNELEWIADLAWNVGIILLKSTSKDYLNDKDQIGTVNSDGGLEYFRLTVAATFFEHAELIYTHALPDDSDLRIKSRLQCILVAIAIRLEADNDMQVSTSVADMTTFNTQRMSNLQKASEFSKKFDSILRDKFLCNEFEHPELKKLRNTSVVLKFGILCKSSTEVDQTLQLVRENQSQYLLLTPSELYKCSKVAAAEGGNMQLSREMLSYGLQVCHRDVDPDFQLMGQIFVELIELSPSRADALQKIEDFVQLSHSLANTERQKQFNKLSLKIHQERNRGEAGGGRETVHKKSEVSSQDDDFNVSDIQLPFTIETIDRIASMAYNYGVTLLDLDQTEMAERFVAKALSLTPYTSVVIRNWIPRIQDTYLHIQQAQSDNAKKSKSLATHFYEQADVLASSRDVPSIVPNSSHGATSDKLDGPLCFQTLMKE